MSDAAAAGLPAAPAPAASAPTPAAPPRLERFAFTGSAREYFGIWIVNLFLTLATLGIYSAWAKVRKKRYFYGHTRLAGTSFAYHGDPVAILKGRLIAVAAFVAYTLATQFSPRLGAAIFLALMPAVPWLLVRSFAFNAVNSSYRNLRFHFRGTYREALGAVWPVFAFAALGLALPELDPDAPPTAAEIWLLTAPLLLAILAYPYVVARVRLLHANRSFYGSAAFACTARVPSFYFVYVNAALIAVAAIIVFGAFALMTASLVPPLLVVALPAGYFLGAVLVFAFTRARIANLVFNAASLADLRLVSTLSTARLARLYAVNLAAIVATVGLAIPWAAIRTARYRAECLALAGERGLDDFLADVSRDVAATGEEMGEVFAVDLSL